MAHRRHHVAALPALDLRARHTDTWYSLITTKKPLYSPAPPMPGSASPVPAQWYQKPWNWPSQPSLQVGAPAS